MKYLQKDLLNEGFWDGFKPRNWGKVAKGAVRMGAQIGRVVAPEIMNPLDNAKSSILGFKNAFKQGYEGQPSDLEMKSDAKYKVGQEVSKKLYDTLSLNLAGKNIKIIPKHGIKEHGVNPKNREKLYILKGQTPGDPKGHWIVVNASGQIF